jgi:ATP-dependent exoDNAse (exonuclease V) beta subunit
MLLPLTAARAKPLITKSSPQDLFYVSATRAREGLTVVTSDSIGLQESISVSSDRQSATELARRAAYSNPSKTVAFDDLYQTYQAQQMAVKPVPPQPTLQKEMTQNVDRTHSGQGISF